MGERLLNRVFNTAAAQQAHQEENEHPQEKAAATEEDHLRRSDTPMDAKDAIKRILLAQRDKNWFRWVPQRSSSCTDPIMSANTVAATLLHQCSAQDPG